MRHAGRVLLLVLVALVACSSESTLVGAGACDAYCFKLVGAKCKASPTREACLDECTYYQGQCAREWNDFLRCATIDATIACDSGTSKPKVIGCDKFQAAGAKVCGSYDAGPRDAL
ncbi:MAG: hypothetical protein ABI175_01375 [Polyangiales bacterium]